MARIVTGIDLGLRNAKLLRGHTKGNSFRVTDFAVLPLDSREITDGWAGLAPPFKPGSARIGLTGRDVNIRYTRVPRVPDWQLRNLMRFEVEEIGDQSGAGVASDFNLLPQLPEIEGEDVVLLAMAREGLLEAHAAGVEGRGRRARGLLAQRDRALQRLPALRRGAGRDRAAGQHRLRQHRRGDRARAGPDLRAQPGRRLAPVRGRARAAPAGLGREGLPRSRRRWSTSIPARAARRGAGRARARRGQGRGGPAAGPAAVDRALLQEPDQDLEPQARPRAALRRRLGAGGIAEVPAGRPRGAGRVLRSLPRGRHQRARARGAAGARAVQARGGRRAGPGDDGRRRHDLGDRAPARALARKRALLRAPAVDDRRGRAGARLAGLRRLEHLAAPGRGETQGRRALGTAGRAPRRRTARPRS